MPNWRERKRKSVRFPCLETNENDPEVEEVPGEKVNVSTGQVNISDISGVMPGKTRIGPVNILAL